jgi:FkbM family methyltransferase
LRLKEHLLTNKIENVITFPYAVSDKKGKVNFYSIDWAGANTLNSDKFDIDNCKITQVDCISFSDIFVLTKIDMFELAKIDCEGSEFPMLINASDESILKIKNFIIEVHIDKIYSVNDLVVKFNRLDYKTAYKGDILIASL